MHNVRTLEQQTALYITQTCQLLPPERSCDKILTALSGGADSVALLRMIIRLGYTTVAAHCNFHLRGDESERDEAFVRNLCNQLGIHLHVTHFDTQAYATQQGISIEMAARKLRYQWFEELCQKHGYTHVAVAHHRDDSVETVLLNLIRGTGIHGLTGIKPRKGRIIRPFLQTDRKNIIEYLAALGQSYVTDSSNLCDNYVRNYIRLSLLPMMEKLNPSVRQSIAETAERLEQTACIYDDAVCQAMERICNKNQDTIDIPALLKEKNPQTVLYELLASKGFNASQTKQIYQCMLTGESGKVFQSSKYRLLRDRETLILTPIGHNQLPEEGNNGFTYSIHNYTPDFAIPRDKETACIDAETVKLPLSIRLYRQGDRFAPFGMGGKKKLVSDYLTDCKRSRFQKERQQVVCDAEGRIVWLVDERSDERFKVTAKTRQVIIIKATGINL
ncbi:MAG: tRNA lysidine(34) synthetase TilS [Bacteroidaceae bacterium]|nr:tRNA lysidine(34) synthetase TilS [Bacteroidaceae bacterium]